MPAERLLAMMKTMQDAVFLLGCEQEVIYLNPAAIRVMGKDLPMLYGHTAAEAVQGVHIVDGPFRQDGDPNRNDSRVYDAQLTPIYSDDDDQLVGYCLLLRDVTEQHVMRRMLEHERSLLRSLIDSNPDLIFYKDTQCAYLGWNTTFAAYSGRNMSELKPGATDADFYPPEKAAAFLESDRRVVEGESQSYENWTTGPDGQPVLLETHKTPFYGPTGEVLGIIGVGRDITKHRMVEDALRNANAEIEQLIASLSSMLIVLSPSLTVRRWNATAQKILGLPAKTTVGLRLDELGIDWDWKPIADSIEICRNERHSVYMDPTRFRRQDGSEGMLGINVSPVVHPEGDLDGFILLCADITERKLLEQRMAQSQKLESIGQLAAGIAHEINTPIQYVSANTSFVLEGFEQVSQVLNAYRQTLAGLQGQFPALDEALANLEALAQSVDADYLSQEIPLAIQQSMEGIQRVSEIVRAMKEFSHPGAKTKTSQDLNKSLESTVKVASNEWKYVANVEFDLDPNLPSVLCMPNEMTQVFLNIIVNAAQAIAEVHPPGSLEKGTIRVQTRRDGDCVEVRISDSGPGITPEVGAHMFEPFYTTKDVGKGTGQGLAIAYDIVVAKHGGSLTYESKPGQGATFIIHLPIDTLG